MPNESGDAHDLVVEGTDDQDAGSSKSGTAKASGTLKAGTYTYFCSVPGHREAGMAGQAHRQVAARAAALSSDADDQRQQRRDQHERSDRAADRRDSEQQPERRAPRERNGSISFIHAAARAPRPLGRPGVVRLVGMTARARTRGGRSS